MGLCRGWSSVLTLVIEDSVLSLVPLSRSFPYKFSLNNTDLIYAKKSLAQTDPSGVYGVPWLGYGNGDTIWILWYRLSCLRVQGSLGPAAGNAQTDCRKSLASSSQSWQQHIWSDLHIWLHPWGNSHSC